MVKLENNKVKQKSKTFLILMIIMSICIIIGLIYIFLMNYKMKIEVQKDVFYDNIYIEACHLGGLTKEEAKKLIEDKYLKPLQDKKITLKYNNTRWVIFYSELNASYNIDEVVNEAYNVARFGKLRDRYYRVLDLKVNPKKFSLTYSFDKTKLEEKLNALEKDINIDKIDSKFQRVNGVFTGTNEQIGKKLDVSKTLELIIPPIVSQKDAEILVVVNEILPKYTKDYYNKMNHRIGSYNTTISKGTQGRLNNIKLAASKINGSIIYPGEIFSANKALGDTTIDNGYMLAPIILNGKLEDGIGGGVCQVSSTLYNAVMYSELEVVERQCHSRPVGYVEKGRDATLAWDYLDFKFKNSTQYPIYIESNVENNQVNVRIYGFESRKLSRTLKFESVVTEVISPPADNIIEDPTLKVGTKVYVSQPKEGYKVKVYKAIYEADKLIDKVHISTSTYRPARGELKIGTKK